MKKAVLYLVFIYLLVPIAFCTKVYSQSNPADQGSQQSAEDAVDTEKAVEDAKLGESEKELQPAEGSAATAATGEDKPASAPFEEPKPDAAQPKESASDTVESEPSATVSHTSLQQSVAADITPRVSSPTSPRPSSGTGLIIAGSIVLGIGGLNLLTTPLCYLLFDPDDEYDGEYVVLSRVDEAEETARDVCVIASLGVGGVMVAVGLPLLIVGLSDRSDYNEWREKNPGLAGLDIRIGEHTAVASWKTAF